MNCFAKSANLTIYRLRRYDSTRCYANRLRPICLITLWVNTLGRFPFRLQFSADGHQKYGFYCEVYTARRGFLCVKSFWMHADHVIGVHWRNVTADKNLISFSSITKNKLN